MAVLFNETPLGARVHHGPDDWIWPHGRVCVRYGDIRMLDTPMKSPIIELHQFWHRRFPKDAAHTWLRGVVHPLFTAAGALP